ncbi:acyl-CoA dehydrogenase family protein [Chloroflexota bacterium]
MADLGIMGIPFSEEYGGGGGDWVGMNLCVEEITRGDAGLGIMLDVTLLVTNEIKIFGREDQKRKWLPALVRGEEIAAFALTEPDAGSDQGRVC